MGIQDQIKTMTFSSDSTRAVTLEATGTITVWSVPEGRQVWQTNLQTTRGLDYALLSPDNRTLAGVYDSALLNRQTRRWEPVILLWSLGNQTPRRYEVRQGVQVTDLVFSPDARWVYFNGPGHSIQALDVGHLSVARTYQQS